MTGGKLKKRMTYDGVLFDSKAISDAERAIRSLLPPDQAKVLWINLDVEIDDAHWSFDTFEEFLAAADAGSCTLQMALAGGQFKLLVHKKNDPGYSSVEVAANTRIGIEFVWAVFEANSERCRIPSPKEQAKIFIGHGRNNQWRDLKDHLQDKHDHRIVAYEIGSRTGRGIKSVLEEMLEESSVALLVMTGEDRTKQGTLRARQNVVHEAGLFQGKLGFTRVAILREHGTEEFSNLYGIQEIRFPKGKIRETFGDVLAFLERELW
jgi:predicted nucleotide-binding protein